MQTLTPAPTGLHGTLAVPGDKSISHRALMLGAISEGDTTIHHFLTGEDCLSTLGALQALGAKIERQGETVVVHGQGWAGLTASAHPLEMGNSGTTTRLLMGLLAGRPFQTTLLGDQSLHRRPMRRVAEPLRHFGGEVRLSPQGTLPATIFGQPLHAATYQMTVASAQVKSALILAALQAPAPSTIIEQLPTRNHTELMLQQFGANLTTAADQRTITVHPAPHLHGQTVHVPGDLSSAAFFLVAAAIVPGSNVTLTQVNLNPTRTGILRVLQAMGASVTITPRISQGEPLGDITVSHGPLRPIQIGAAEIPALIDELPLVALLAACADGTSEIRGAAELRVKETDRIATVASELRKLGVAIEELPDGMIITGRPNWALQTSTLTSHGDHRIGMMLAVATLKARQPLTLAEPEAIAISYPTFFRDLAQLKGEER